MTDYTLQMSFFSLLYLNRLDLVRMNVRLSLYYNISI